MKTLEEINKIWRKENRISIAKGRLTLNQIASSMGVSIGALDKISSGTVGVYLHRIVQIAEAIGCKPADLLPQQWKSSTSITFNDVMDIAEIFCIIDEVEKEKNAKLSNDAKARTFIALYIQLKNRNDNDNEEKIDILNYATAYIDAVLNQ